MGLFGFNLQKRKQGNRLNMAIAKTHQLSSRIIGMQLTGGSFIGITLSATQLAIGFVDVGEEMIKGNVWIEMFVGFIGALLAILIERLSLGGLALVRLSWKELEQLHNTYHAMKKPKEHHTKLYNIQKRKCYVNMGVGASFALLGMSLSVVLGDVFWSHLFAGIQDERVRTFYAIACALVVGLSFVYGELFKEALDKVVREILMDFHIMKVGIISEEQNLQIDMMTNVYEDVRNDAEVLVPAEERIKGVVARRLTGFARQVSNVGTRVDQIVEGSLVSGSGLQALPSPRKKYLTYREELLRLLAANPNASQRDVAAHFGVSQSTGGEWLRKAKAGE